MPISHDKNFMFNSNSPKYTQYYCKETGKYVTYKEVLTKQMQKDIEAYRKQITTKEQNERAD